MNTSEKVAVLIGVVFFIVIVFLSFLICFYYGEEKAIKNYIKNNCTETKIVDAIGSPMYDCSGIELKGLDYESKRIE